jgi:hypothetical protein
MPFLVAKEAYNFGLVPSPGPSSTTSHCHRFVVNLLAPASTESQDTEFSSTLISNGNSNSVSVSLFAHKHP